jgi:hypothetical protein
MKKKLTRFIRHPPPDAILLRTGKTFSLSIGSFGANTFPIALCNVDAKACWCGELRLIS